MFVVAAHSACGASHAKNDDRILVDDAVLTGAEAPGQSASTVKTLSIPAMVAVFDGVGGSKRGDKAARLAADSLIDNADLGLEERLRRSAENVTQWQQTVEESSRGYTVCAGVFISPTDLRIESVHQATPPVGSTGSPYEIPVSRTDTTGSLPRIVVEDGVARAVGDDEVIDPDRTIDMGAPIPVPQNPAAPGAPEVVDAAYLDEETPAVTSVDDLLSGTEIVWHGGSDTVLNQRVSAEGTIVSDVNVTMDGAGDTGYAIADTDPFVVDPTEPIETAPVLCRMFHAGDSRVYRMRDGEVMQMTIDHSLSQAFREKYGAHAQIPMQIAHVVTRFIGGDDINPFEIANPYPLEDGDVLLMCSDGLWEFVTSDEMAAIMGDAMAEMLGGIMHEVRAQEIFERCAETLVQTAKANGSSDDVSVALVVRLDACDVKPVEEEEVADPDEPRVDPDVTAEIVVPPVAVEPEGVTSVASEPEQAASVAPVPPVAPEVPEESETVTEQSVVSDQPLREDAFYGDPADQSAYNEAATPEYAEDYLQGDTPEAPAETPTAEIYRESEHDVFVQTAPEEPLPLTEELPQDAPNEMFQGIEESEQDISLEAYAPETPTSEVRTSLEKEEPSHASGAAHREKDETYSFVDDVVMPDHVHGEHAAIPNDDQVSSAVDPESAEDSGSEVGSRSRAH